MDLDKSQLSNMQFFKQGYFSKVYRAQLTVGQSTREVAVKMLKERELGVVTM